MKIITFKMGDVSVLQQLGKEISDSSLEVQLHGLKEAGDAFRDGR